MFKHDLYCEDQGIRCVTHILLLDLFNPPPPPSVCLRIYRASPATIIWLHHMKASVKLLIPLSFSNRVCIDRVCNIFVMAPGNAAQKSNPVSNVCQKRCNRLNCTPHPHTQHIVHMESLSRTTVCIFTAASARYTASSGIRFSHHGMVNKWFRQ